MEEAGGGGLLPVEAGRRHGWRVHQRSATGGRRLKKLYNKNIDE
jgi:hypothetical protein